jgi:hypothetical protein
MWPFFLFRATFVSSDMPSHASLVLVGARRDFALPFILVLTKVPRSRTSPAGSIAMKKLDRYARKSYAMRRMTLAIERAIKRPTRGEKERAARWAAAWGLLCGIRTEGVKLKACDVESLASRIEQTYDSTITIASFQPQFPSSQPSSIPLSTHATAELAARSSAQPKPV